MNTRDMEALRRYQSSRIGQTEHSLFTLERTVDDLTDLAKTEQGFHQIALQRDVLLNAMRKLHDIFQETVPTLAAAE